MKTRGATAPVTPAMPAVPHMTMLGSRRGMTSCRGVLVVMTLPLALALLLLLPPSTEMETVRESKGREGRRSLVTTWRGA